ncbi:MAG: glycerol-3-phosphate 1-O-acyltransferase PlsY [Planctomycetes bacterium]|nr:glycerol-3-phosphate 1-O-acyltransferase PlsY [Planctomycetota bacterium]
MFVHVFFLQILPVLLLTYLIAAIPFGYVIPKIFKKTDIRTLGSGNIGATNVARAVGWPYGIAVFVLDFAKGCLPTLFLPMLMNSLGHFNQKPNQILVAQTLTGVTAICGHMLPIYLRFKGGKGVATSAGVFAALVWLPAVIAFGVWLVLTILTRYVSIGSICAATALPFAVFFDKKDSLDFYMPVFLLSCFAALLVIAKHRSNIRRLLNGTEHKIRL